VLGGVDNWMRWTKRQSGGVMLLYIWKLKKDGWEGR
jgi:hypothetical protein